MAGLSSLDQGLIKGLGTRWEIPRRRQVQLCVESVDGKDVAVNNRADVRRRTGTAVFGADEKVVEDLSTEHTACNSCVLREPGGVGRDIIHTPGRKGCRDVVEYNRETAGAGIGAGPRQFGGLISAGASIG